MRILLSKGQTCEPPSKAGPLGCCLKSPSVPDLSFLFPLLPMLRGSNQDPGAAWDGRPRCLRALIPTILGLILLALLGLLAKRIVQDGKAVGWAQ